MHRVVLMMSVSVDGYVVGPHGHAGELSEPDELRRWKLDRIRQAGTHKVVFSKTVAEATWSDPRSRAESSQPRSPASARNPAATMGESPSASTDPAREHGRRKSFIARLR